MTGLSVRELLELGMTPEEVRLYGDLIRDVTATFRVRSDPDRNRVGEDLYFFLGNALEHEQGVLTGLRSLADEFGQRVARAEDGAAEKEQILEFARRLGATSSGLGDDRRAFKRWFGFDAVMERCTRRMDTCQYRIAFYLGRIGEVVTFLVRELAEPESQKKLWQRLDPEGRVREFFAFRGDERVQVAAFRALARAMTELLPEVRREAVGEGTLRFVYRSALERSRPFLVQAEALSLLGHLSVRDLDRAIALRLGDPEDGDDFFIRRRAVLLAGEYGDRISDPARFLRQGLVDGSVYVRRTVCAVTAELLCRSVLEKKGGARLLARAVLKDEAFQVRAEGVLAAGTLMADRNLFKVGLALLDRILDQEEHTFVLRTALRTVSQVDGFAFEGREELFRSRLFPRIELLHVEAADLRVRRYAAMARERIRVGMDGELASLRDLLAARLHHVRPGKSVRISNRDLGNVEAASLGRVLSVLAQDGHTLSAGRSLFGGWRITKGDTFVFRFWRLWHELGTPSPDKRQAHRHTVGRLSMDRIVAPSSIMSELTRTKVPGEPLYMSGEDGWRPYLPLPDEVLSALKDKGGSRETLIFTPEGVTRLRPSKWIGSRIFGAVRLSFGFERYADLRNWSEDSGAQPDEYVRALEGLGTSVEHAPHGEPDPSVQRFFALGIPMGTELWDRFTSYFFSVYQNSLYELGLFAAGLGAWFAGRTIFLSRRVYASRKRIPLVVGGWGTRGKSGVERIKTGLFEYLGHPLVAKTTGCEAMFLTAHPFGRTREMFLFRPYDKATIWEQTDLMNLTVRLGGKVFLWECMALTPAFVRILQRHWARDDISTITNTYPDHEDIQGPAGYDIPNVMTEFIPARSTLVSSEEQMRPILEQGAREVNTSMTSVDWLRIGLLAPEVLARFPYEEHPANIALVTVLAERMGVPEEVVLKEMADRVVPDIGVLKGFPWARVGNRFIEFVNGMSANERFAALGNWERMEFADQEVDGKTVLVTLVNNRADRVSRSRMFASILVRDLSADRHVLIGSNLKGLQGYMRESLDEWLESVSLAPERNQGRSAQETLAHFGHRLRVPMTGEQVQAGLETMLLTVITSDLVGSALKNWENPGLLKEGLKKSGAGEGDVLEIMAHHERSLTFFQEYHELEEIVGRSGEEGERLLQKRIREWFLAKVVTVDDVHADGERIIHDVLASVPPGIRVRVMGMQNIKGPGLDFVYRWQGWEACRNSLDLLMSGEEELMEKGLAELMTFQEHGQLTREAVLEAVHKVRSHPAAQSEKFQAGLNFIESAMNQAVEEVFKGLTSGGGGDDGIVSRVITLVEEFLDAGDGVRRRKAANRIYKDMAAERISTDRAALELKKLNKRQKGGWLKEVLSFKG